MSTPSWLARLNENAAPVTRLEFERLERSVRHFAAGEGFSEPWPDLPEGWGKGFQHYERAKADPEAAYEQGIQNPHGQVYLEALREGLVPLTPAGIEIFIGWALRGAAPIDHEREPEIRAWVTEQLAIAQANQLKTT